MEKIDVTETLSVKEGICQQAQQAIARQQEALASLSAHLDPVTLVNVVEFLAHNTGRLIVTGVGKSGHIARKIAATMASLGKPAQFIHATEASHGDFGMITPQDALLALSWSGRSPEILEVGFFAQRFAIPLIVFTAQRESPLVKMAQFSFILPSVQETCPTGLAPTTSSMLQLVLGDILAICLSKLIGFTPYQFKNLHPAGQLGASLLTASDIMYKGKLPLVDMHQTLAEALACMAQCRFWCVGVINPHQNLVGILTDSILERAMREQANQEGFLQQKIESIMLKNFQSIHPAAPLRMVFDLMRTFQLHSLFVVEEEKAIGIISIHDLFKYGFS